MGDHQPRGNDGYLVPGMPPELTRVLAVGGDPARLNLIVRNLDLRGYQVTSSTDPEAALAALRQDSLQGRLSFDVVMVDRSEYPGGARAAAGRLFEFAVREPQLSAYGIKENATFGPLSMEDLNEFMKPIYNVESNGPKSPEATPNGPYNTSPSLTTSTITKFSFSGRRAGRRGKKHISDTESREVEQDGEHAERERQQPSQNPKKARVVWTDELHKKFVAAYNKLKPEDRVPNKILELMINEYPTVTRENIASHLQKYRLNLEREKCADPLPRSHSRTKRHMSTTQASCASPNMSRQQAPPTLMQSRHETVYDDRLGIHTQTLKTMNNRNKCEADDAPPKKMYPGDDDPKQYSVCRVGNSNDNLQEDLSENLRDPGPSWENDFLLSSSD